MCGNKSKSLVYMDQARILAGQIFDSAEIDAVVGMLFMSFYSMLTFDLSRTSFYSNIGASLCKMISEGKVSNKLSAICQLTTIMSDNTITTHQQARQFRQLINSLTHKSNQEQLICNKVSMIAELVQVFDHRLFYLAPTGKVNVFQILDNLVVREETRLTIFDIMNQLLINEANEVGNCTSYMGKICIPVNRAVLNWKSGHVVEAMENALSCFYALQTIEDECLYDLLLHSTELYLMGALVKLFLEQGQFLLAQKMGMQVIKICSRMKPDLDDICQQVENLLQTHFASHNSTSPENIFTTHPPPHPSSSPLPLLPPSSSPLPLLSPSHSPPSANNSSPEIYSPPLHSTPSSSLSPSPLPSPENTTHDLPPPTLSPPSSLSPPPPSLSLPPPPSLSLPPPFPISFSAVQWLEENNTPENISPENLPPLFFSSETIPSSPPSHLPSSPSLHSSPLPFSPSLYPSPLPFPSVLANNTWRMEDIEKILGLN
eukprot:Phypoly_transcript_03639.p1 GENE.Phypoly_transcript_03639~~Phypoly_transcript_03639.p1  ORF type:complete len:487 (+),score=147.92 Phypoly_transcript_03639:897-2357(+)